MEYQNGQPLLGRAPAGAHGPQLERISRRQVTVPVPKTAGHDGEPFYPQSLERGRRSVRAVMLAVRRDVHQGRVHPGGRGRDARIRDREPVFVAGQPRRQAAG